MAPAFIATDMLTMGRAWVSTKRRVTPFLSTTRFGSILGEARDVEAQRSITENMAGNTNVNGLLLLQFILKSLLPVLLNSFLRKRHQHSHCPVILHKILLCNPHYVLWRNAPDFIYIVFQIPCPCACSFKLTYKHGLIENRVLPH